ncbi:MAG: tetratricopeptide repeat protein [Bacteroidia bacterium]|nr:MAG: tetratricopeptide repeat protein [Bacteroidia bacterium]
MKTQKTIYFVLCLVCGIFLLSKPLTAQISEAEKLFEAGVYQQEAAGNFEEAIILFNRLVKEYPNERVIAAKALMRLGICYERQGSQKASEAYQQIISQYPDQVSLVNQARSRLAELGSGEPAGLIMTRLYPPDLYLECQTLSPDGTKLAYIDFDIGQNLAIYDLVSGEKTLLTSYDYEAKSIYTYSPVWSPDNKEIVYHAGKFDDQENESVTLSITTLEGKTHVLYKNTDKGGVAPCDWLPDKSAVIAASGNQDGLHKLVSISTKDGSSRDLCMLQRTFSNSDIFTDEASLMADVSPDGQLIVFSDSEGPNNGQRDIYTISPTDGTKRILIQHPADDREPRWSPDGRNIVFMSNRHGSWALWGVAIRDGEPNGLPFMILEGMQDTDLASWTKDGLCSRTMAIINEIYLLKFDPQTKKVVGKPEIMESQDYGKSFFPQWSPDGKYLSYRSTLGGSQSLNILVKPTNGGESRSCKYDYKVRPVAGAYQWLPDGSGIGFVYSDKENNIYFSLLDPETGESNTRQVPTGDYKGGLVNLVWEGDGKAFFFVKVGDTAQETGIVRHDMETGKERFIFVNQPDDSLIYSWFSLKISPDHKSLALNKGKFITTVDINSGKFDQMQFDELKAFNAPTWSPDGNYLLVKGVPKGGSEANELYIISLADRTCTSLNISQYLPKGARIFASHDWSPDGKTIAFDTRSWKSEANLIRNLIPEK